MGFGETIRRYYDTSADEYHRYRSWEYCYSRFRAAHDDRSTTVCDELAMQLGFYLASWGMYRGSSFLLQYAYTVHRGVVDLVQGDEYRELWSHEFGSSDENVDLIPAILGLAQGVKDAYRPFSDANSSNEATDTLATKALLGTFGCVPACDRYFIAGFTGAGLSYSYLNHNFLERLLHFSLENRAGLRAEQERIQDHSGIRYPLMKLVDMHFWQAGYDQESATAKS